MENGLSTRRQGRGAASQCLTKGRFNASLAGGFSHQNRVTEFKKTACHDMQSVLSACGQWYFIRLGRNTISRCQDMMPRPPARRVHIDTIALDQDGNCAPQPISLAQTGVKSGAASTIGITIYGSPAIAGDRSAGSTARPGENIGTGHGPGDPACFLSVAEQDHGGDAANTELSGEVLVFV